MDKLTWFKFTPSDWMMGKIQRCPADTRGMFMNLCCLYWNKECDLSAEDAEIEVDEEHFSILLKKKIIALDGENIRISFLDEQMEEILETSEKRREAANKRWAKKNASAMQVHKSAMQNDADKSKIREEGDKEKNREDIFLCSLSDETELSNNYQRIAFSFWKLFKQNLIDSGIKKTTTLDKAKLPDWENDIRLSFEQDGRSKQEFEVLWHFLKKSDFWKKNIQSTKKLRQQFERLFIEAAKEQKKNDPHYERKRKLYEKYHGSQQ